MNNAREYGKNLTKNLTSILEEIHNKSPPFGVPEDEIDYYGDLIKKYKNAPRSKEDVYASQISARLIRHAKQGYEVQFIAKHFLTFKTIKESMHRQQKEKEELWDIT